MSTLMRPSSRRADDDGFTLVEVLIALGILMVVSLSILPLMIMTVRAGEQAKASTQAKNLLQERVELMRNLPFHVPYSTGAQYVDLLDINFHDVSSPSVNSKCNSAAYSSVTKTYTCSLTSLLNFPGFSETIASQFLDKDRLVVTPPAGYNSQSAAGSDFPPAQLLGVTITVSYQLYGKSKSFTSSTLIGNAAATPPQTVAKLRVSAVSVDSTVDDDSPPTLAHFDASLVTADAGVSTGATARGSATGAYGSLSSGATTTNQAAGYVDAPPDQPTFVTASGSASGGVPCTSGVACFGATLVSNVTGSAAGGVPQVGSASAPMSASIVRGGSSGDRGYWFSNVPTGLTQIRLVRLGVQDALVPPTLLAPTQLVRSIQGSPNSGYSVPCSGSPTALSNADFTQSTGSVVTAAGAAHSVTACVTATARRVDIMPTNFAPDGVVQVTLNYASLNCTSTGSASAAPTARWSASLRYWSGLLNAYAAPLTISDSTGSPLTAALLVKGPGGVQVGRDASNNILWLGDYIASWTSGTVNGSSTSGTTRQTDLTPVALTTTPTRDSDATGQSGVNVTLGESSCLAQDNR